jgi:hypothetical protein
LKNFSERVRELTVQCVKQPKARSESNSEWMNSRLKESIRASARAPEGRFEVLDIKSIPRW